MMIVVLVIPVSVFNIARLLDTRFGLTNFLYFFLISRPNSSGVLDF